MSSIVIRAQSLGKGSGFFKMNGSDLVLHKEILAHGQVPDNLTYYAQAPMLGYQPRPGEWVGFFVTTGDTRRMNVQPAAFEGRSNVVTVPFQAGTYTWAGKQAAGKKARR